MVQPYRSDRLLNRVGINTHQAFRTSVYANDNSVLHLLKGLHIRRVRDRLSVNLPAQHAAFRKFKQNGIRVHSTVELLGDSRSDIDKFMVKARQLGGAEMFCSFGGVNEPNVHSGWLRDTVEHQRMIKRSRNAHGLSHIPICGPSLHDRKSHTDEDYAALARSDMARYTDAGDLHCYPDGGGTNERLDGRRRQAKRVYGNQPVWCTETGYNTGTWIDNAGNGVPEDVEAIYMTRLLLSHFLRGSRAYLYELLDDPTRNDYESNWGLVKCPSKDPRTWRKKEAYHSVAALLGQASDPGRAFKPRPIPLRIDAPNYVNTLVMGKRNGSAILYMWRDVDLWNSNTKRRKSVSPVDVTVVDSDGRRTIPVGGKLVARRIHR